MLQLLAFQIGKEVSCSELGASPGMSKNTVDHYLDFLEKAFVIQRLDGFSRNLRNEITKNSRYYFIDNGVRNALINSFNPIDLRNDTGELSAIPITRQPAVNNTWIALPVSPWSGLSIPVRGYNE